MKLSYLLLGTIVAPLLGCKQSSPDLVWSQNKIVSVKGRDFQQCIRRAVARVPSISIDSQNSTSVDIALDLSAIFPTQKIAADIQMRPGDKAEIIVYAQQSPSTEDVTRSIVRLMGDLTQSVQTECNVAM